MVTYKVHVEVTFQMLYKCSYRFQVKYMMWVQMWVHLECTQMCSAATSLKHPPGLSTIHPMSSAHLPNYHTAYSTSTCSTSSDSSQQPPQSYQLSNTHTLLLSVFHPSLRVFCFHRATILRPGIGPRPHSQATFRYEFSSIPLCLSSRESAQQS